MTYRYQLYKCPICGTVTEIVHDGVSAMICCGKTMEVLDDREPVGTKESHMPVVEATEKGCKVSVGSKLHGMDADHLIEWAEIRTSDDTVLRKYFKALYIWASTVRSETPSTSAISLFLPAPTVTSTALGVRNSPAVL